MIPKGSRPSRACKEECFVVLSTFKILSTIPKQVGMQPIMMNQELKFSESKTSAFRRASESERGVAAEVEFIRYCIFPATPSLVNDGTNVSNTF